MLAHLRLLQLLSPLLPVGSYSYSQGLEWAVDQQWISNDSEFENWLSELISGALAQQDLPLLKRLHESATQENVIAFEYWSYMALAMRDTAELRAEERARAGSYERLLQALPDKIEDPYLTGIRQTPLAAIAWAAARWKIDKSSLLNAYAHNWLEAYVINGVKIIPLGQSQGQAILFAMHEKLSEAVEFSGSVDDAAMGFTAPAISQASCGHETQYSRVYRS